MNETLINDKLKPIIGYLLSIVRNTEMGWFELKMGIPDSWIFGDNDEINCQIENDLENGKIVRISPKNDNIIIDDLVLFGEKLIETNQKITNKKKEFDNQMKEMKASMEAQAAKFYEELENMQKKSFTDLTNKNNKTTTNKNNKTTTNKNNKTTTNKTTKK